MIGAAEFRVGVPAEREEVTRFDTPAEFMAGLRPDASNTNVGSHGIDRNGFYGDAKTYADAVRLAETGWPTGLARVAPLIGDLTAEFAGRILREEWTPDVVGNYVDPGRYLAGEPDCFMRLEEVETHIGHIRPRVKILMNRGVAGDVGSDVIEARGAATVALVDLLELAGYAVSITIVFAVTSPSRSRLIVDYITIKPENQRADLSTLAFWLAHPSAQRRLHFARRESFDAHTRQEFEFGGRYGTGYGRSVDPSINEFEPDIYISAGHVGTPAGYARWTNLDATRAWLEETLKTLGVKLSPKANS